MRLIKARVQGYRSVIDSGWFDVESGKTILVGPNEAGKTAILQALQKLNPPDGIELFDPLRDYPRAKYDEDIEKGGVNPSTHTVVEGHFFLEDNDKEKVPNAYRDAIYIFGRHLDNSTWHDISNVPAQLTFSEVEKDFLKMIAHFQDIAFKENVTQDLIDAIQTEYETAISGIDRSSIITVDQAKQLHSWLKRNIKYLDDNNSKENARYEKIESQIERPEVHAKVLASCKELLPKFILFSNYFRIKPVLHLRKLADRIASNSLDDSQYDYGNICLLKFLGFTPKELADAGDTSAFNLNDPTQYERYKAQLDTRDYRLNAATIRLTQAICEVWNPMQDSRDANKLRIKVDGQYLKVVVEDELGVEVELDQRSEGFQWMFFHKKNLVLEGLTDMWYLESLSSLLTEGGKTGINEQIAMIPANCASKVVYFATILKAQHLKIAALLDSDAEGELAAKQDILVNELGNKRILRTKDVYDGPVATPEIEDILRDTLLDIAKDQCGWDVIEMAKAQEKRPIVDILVSEVKRDFSKYKLSKAFVRWAREHTLSDLQKNEIVCAEKLAEKINKALQ